MVIRQLEVMSCQQNSTASASRSVSGEHQIVLAEMREQQNCMRQDNVLLRNSLIEQKRPMTAQALEPERRDKLLFSSTQPALHQPSLKQEEMTSSSRTPGRVRTTPYRPDDIQQMATVGYVRKEGFHATQRKDWAGAVGQWCNSTCLSVCP